MPLDGARGPVATGRAGRISSCSALDRGYPAAQVASPAARESPPPQLPKGCLSATTALGAALPSAARQPFPTLPRVCAASSRGSPGCHPQPRFQDAPRASSSPGPAAPRGLGILTAQGAQGCGLTGFPARIPGLAVSLGAP